MQASDSFVLAILPLCDQDCLPPKDQSQSCCLKMTAGEVSKLFSGHFSSSSFVSEFPDHCISPIAYSLQKPRTKEVDLMLEPTIPIVKQGYLAYSFNTIARTVRILDPYSNQGSIPCKSGPRAFGRHKRLRLCSFRQRTLRELRTALYAAPRTR